MCPDRYFALIASIFSEKQPISMPYHRGGGEGRGGGGDMASYNRANGAVVAEYHALKAAHLALSCAATDANMFGPCVGERKYSTSINVFLTRLRAGIAPSIIIVLLYIYI